MGAAFAVPRRIMGSRLGVRAAQSLAKIETEIKGTLDTAMTALKQTGKRNVRQLAAEAVGKRPASSSAAGSAAAAVMQGPAKTAKDLVGQQVAEAAASGPPVSTTALKEEAQRILEQKIKPAATAFPRTKPGDVGAEILAEAGITPEVMARQPPNTLAAMQEAVAGAQAEAEAEQLKHPAMGLITRILNAPDEVPFEAAHLWKVELGNALQGTFDKAERKQVTNLTMHLAGGLRESLRGHAPYDAATAAEELGGKVTWIGKPYRAIYDYALSLIGNPKRVLCIGDSAEHDVAGGRGSGLGTLLVRTGISADAADFDPQPDYLMERFIWR